MSKLVESILENDFVSAQAIFEERIAAIAERKLLEVKKMVQEQTFPAGVAGVEARKKAGFKRASDVLGDPTAGRKTSRGKTGAGDDAGMALQNLRKGWKQASFGERRRAVKMVHQAVKQYAGTQEPPSATTTTTPAQPSSVKTDAQKGFPSQLKREPSSSPVKKLGADRSLRTLDRFSKGMKTIEKLKARGYSPEHAEKKANILRKAYRGARLKSAAGNVARGVGQFVAGALQSVEE